MSDELVLEYERFIDLLMRDRGLSLESAAEEQQRSWVKIRYQQDNKALGKALANIRARIGKIEKIARVDMPGICAARGPNWYTGPGPGSRYWPALDEYLESKKWNVAPIDIASTRIVAQLANPKSPGNFKHRGLVIGYVQSGKTANMTAVIAKAVDAGYRFVIILSGLTNSLREQTQERLDNDLICLEAVRTLWHPWTTVDTDASLPTPFPNLNDQVHFAVLKKNSAVLNRLLASLRRTDPAILNTMPALIIDDECDQASVNNSGFKNRMTRINSQVRTLIQVLPKVSYIGYTATPFANVLIDPSYDVASAIPDDLYPKDFIFQLAKPDSYFGTERLFGRDLLDADETLPSGEVLDMIRTVPDDEVGRLRPGKNSPAFEVTPSLERAIRYFILVTGARIARGDASKHSSMLVHTTVRAGAHFQAKTAIDKSIKEIRKRLSADDNILLREFERLWQEESVRVSAEQFGNRVIPFDEIRTLLPEVLETIDVVVENYQSVERLKFEPVTSADGARRGCRYIVVGGNVLARGLTIEGLAVSFFVRSSSQYDSLMQMGRWFGFRPKYEDLPRVWMTDDMRLSFRDLATVEAEIRRDIEVYETSPVTPLEFAVRVRQIPGMLITAKNKMLSAIPAQISYDGVHRQTFRFLHRNREWLEENWEAASGFLKAAADSGIRAEKRERYTIFRNVPVSLVLEFFRKYRVHERHSDMDIAGKVSEYIQKRNEKTDGSLRSWNVVIPEPSNGPGSRKSLGPLQKVRMVIRSRKESLSTETDADIGALMSVQDIAQDLDTPPPGKLSWEKAKELRPDNRPLLVLYAIDRESRPTVADRVPLDAVEDVLGLGFVIPNPAGELARIHSYVQAPLPQPETEEVEDLDMDEKVEESA